MTSRSSQIAAPPPEGGRRPARSGTSTQPAMAERIPWRSVGTGIAGVGTPAGISVFHPLLGEIMVSVEFAVILTIITTALFATRELSERAFRLLRWFGNRPEPPAPDNERAARSGSSTQTASS